MLMTQSALKTFETDNTDRTKAGPVSNSSLNIRSANRSTTSRNRSQSYSSRNAGYNPAEADSTANSVNNYFTSAYSYHMNGIIGTAPPGTMYVRALYDYEADDRTSLSFHEGDVIQVITQLESGWWDGVINGVRGWFPSNYCQIITDSTELPEEGENGDPDNDEPEDGGFSEQFDDPDESDQDDPQNLPIEGPEISTKSGADFWIPQATADGRLYYFNTNTGQSSMELPLESPTSMDETGPRDRMNVNMPDRTRPPPEMMAGGLNQDEDEDSGLNSSSELEGEQSYTNGRVCSYPSLVFFKKRIFFWPLNLILIIPNREFRDHLPTMSSHHPSLWIP